MIVNKAVRPLAIRFKQAHILTLNNTIIYPCPLGIDDDHDTNITTLIHIKFRHRLLLTKRDKIFFETISKIQNLNGIPTAADVLDSSEVRNTKA